MELQTIPELKDLIPKLKDEEFRQLEENCLRDGITDPIIAWGNVIVDGHNRYQIAERHDLPFKIEFIDFADIEEAKLWIIKRQLGRRNLSTLARIELAEQLREQIEAEARERQRGGQGGVLLVSNSTQAKTRYQLADAAGVANSTYYQGRAILEHAAAHPESTVKQEVLSGEKSINRAYNEIRAAEKPEPTAEPDVLDKIKNDVAEPEPEPAEEPEAIELEPEVAEPEVEPEAVEEPTAKPEPVRLKTKYQQEKDEYRENQRRLKEIENEIKNTSTVNIEILQEQKDRQKDIERYEDEQNAKNFYTAFQYLLRISSYPQERIARIFTALDGILAEDAERGSLAFDIKNFDDAIRKISNTMKGVLNAKQLRAQKEENIGDHGCSKQSDSGKQKIFKLHSEDRGNSG